MQKSKDIKTVYLSGPFAGLDVLEAIQLHKNAAKILVKAGYSVYSPVLSTVSVWLETRDEVSESWWKSLELPVIKALDAIAIIQHPRTFFSEGISRESFFAFSNSKPFLLVFPTGEIQILEPPNDE